MKVFVNSLLGPWYEGWQQRYYAYGRLGLGQLNMRSSPLYSRA